VFSVVGIGHYQGRIVQNKPFLTEMDRDYCMICPASRIIYNQKTQVLGGDPCFAKCHVFDDCVILAITCPCAKRNEWRRPEVVNTVLGPIAYGPDAEIHRAIDLSHPSATLVLPAKFNNLQELACGCGTAGETSAARRKRLLLRLDTGLKIRPFRRDVLRQGLE
jgi:hypothetical protein